MLTKPKFRLGILFCYFGCALSQILWTFRELLRNHQMLKNEWIFCILSKVLSFLLSRQILTFDKLLSSVWKIEMFRSKNVLYNNVYYSKIIIWYYDEPIMAIITRMCVFLQKSFSNRKWVNGHYHVAFWKSIELHLCTLL